MTDKDELFRGIDEAANNLFDQYIVKKPASAAAPPEKGKEDMPRGTEVSAGAGGAAEKPPQPKAQPPAPAPQPPKPAAPVSPPPQPPRKEPVTAAPPQEVGNDLVLELEIEEEKPAPTPPRPVSQPPKPAPADQSLSLKLELDDEPATSADHQALFSEMEEALLTIDWEVNSSNITKARKILAKLITAHEWTDDAPVGQVARQMDTVLASMFESPENSPVSAPSQLKKALQAIKETLAKDGPPDTATRKLLSTTLSNLHAVLVPVPIQDIGLSLELDDDRPAAAAATENVEEMSFDLGMSFDLEDDSSGGPGESVPAATAKVLMSYAKSIAGSVKLITPIEKLFSTRPTLKKLYQVNKKLREKLLSQHELLTGAFSTDYKSYSGFGTIHGWLESQLDALGSCITSISKLEKLYGKTAGYEKLFEISRKIRKSLEKQHDAITVVVGGTPTSHQFDLTGEYPAIIQPQKARPAGRPHERQDPAAAKPAAKSPTASLDECIELARSIELGTAKAPQVSGRRIRESLENLKTGIPESASLATKPLAEEDMTMSVKAASGKTGCRWDWLLKTTWGGQLVGLAPEQVAYESKSSYPVKAFRDKAYFSLKNLKSMPWSNLQNLFSGELAELDKAALNSMELEIARPPVTFAGSSKKKVFLAIMYSGGKGKVYLLDSPTEAISVAEEALWAPGKSSSSGFAGTLTVYGSTMPVISIS